MTPLLIGREGGLRSHQDSDQRVHLHDDLPGPEVSLARSQHSSESCGSY